MAEAIQGRARRYNFSTEAGHRFERGVDPKTTVDHIDRISALILEICGGAAQPIDDQVLKMPVEPRVRLRRSRAEKILGISLEPGVIDAIFKRLNFKVETHGDEFVVTPPSYRFDIAIEEDLIEEVARCYGFERIPAHAPVAQNIMLPASEMSRPAFVLASRLAAEDYQEVINFSFVERDWELDFAGQKNPIEVVNPIASQLAVMRSSLIGSLVANVRYNLNRKASRIRVFEMAKVFAHDKAVKDGPLAVAGIVQPVHIAGLAYGPALDDQWGAPSRTVDFFDVKEDLEVMVAPLSLMFERAEHPALHPGRSAKILLAGQEIGWIGELHPRWLQKYELPLAPVLFEIEVAPLCATQLPTLVEIPRVPAVTRDLALTLESSIEVGQLLRELAELQSKEPSLAIVKEVTLFDEYRGKGLKDNEKSLAFRFRLQDTRQTLSDELIDKTMAVIVTAMSEKFGAQQRS